MKTNTIKKFIGLFFISILVSVFCFTSTSYASEKANNNSENDKECYIDGVNYGLTSYNHEASIIGYDRNIGYTINIPEVITFEDEEYEVKSIGDQAFRCVCSTSVVIPNSITRIGVQAFANSQVQDMYFSGNQPAIWDLAFNNMSFTLHCPLEVTNWDPTAFHLGGAKIIYYHNRSTRFELKGQCYDCGLKLPIKNNKIYVLDDHDKVISIIYSDENGNYDYRIFGDRPFYTKIIKVRTTYQGKTFTSKEISTDRDKHLNIVFN